MGKVAPYGSWKSPVTTELITGRSISLIELALDGQDIYWIESRPKEGGRYTIMRRTPDGKITECTPPEFYVRTTVHEYGGGHLRWRTALSILRISRTSISIANKPAG